MGVGRVGEGRLRGRSRRVRTLPGAARGLQVRGRGRGRPAPGPLLGRPGLGARAARLRTYCLAGSLMADGEAALPVADCGGGGQISGPGQVLGANAGGFRLAATRTPPPPPSGCRRAGDGAGWADWGIGFPAGVEAAPALPPLPPGAGSPSSASSLQVLPFTWVLVPNKYLTSFCSTLHRRGLLVTGWEATIEGPRLLDLLFPSLPPPGGKGLLLPPG